jgi:hypothetical protein
MQGSIWFDEGNSCFQIIAEHNEIGLGRNSKEMFLSWAKNIEVIGNIYEGLHSGENVDGK